MRAIRCAISRISSICSGGSATNRPFRFALGSTNGILGLVGIIFRARENIGLPWNLLEEIKGRLPNLKIVDVTDVFFELRSVKSDEEIRCLEQSAEISSIGFEAHLTAWRPGISERKYYSAVVQAMDAAGAEPPTLLLLESGPLFNSWLTQDSIPSNRELKRGDYIVREASPKYAGYQAQSLRCVVLSKQAPEMRELLNWGVEVWHRFTDLIRPGKVSDRNEAYGRSRLTDSGRNRVICRRRGYPRPSELRLVDRPILIRPLSAPLCSSFNSSILGKQTSFRLRQRDPEFERVLELARRGKSIDHGPRPWHLQEKQSSSSRSGCGQTDRRACAVPRSRR